MLDAITRFLIVTHLARLFLSNLCRVRRFTSGRPAICLALAVIAVASIPIAALADAGDDAYLLSAGFYKKERWDLAAESFQKFIDDFPKHPQVPKARFFLGLSQVKGGDYKAARDTLRAFTTDSPLNPNVPH